MKRLVVLFLVLFLQVSFSFLKSDFFAYAAVTSDNLIQIRSELINTLSNVKIIPITASTTANSEARNEYIAKITQRATTYFNSVKNDQSLTDAKLRSGMGDYLLRTMESEIRPAADLRNIADPVERLRRQQEVDMARTFYGEIQLFFEKGVVTQQVESGVITKSQGDKETANAVKDLETRQKNLTQISSDLEKNKKCNVGFLGTSFSLIDCIDVAVAWVLKTVAMQIAGFVVYLTANLMNLAIKVGILEFSRWAPDTLYPIWLVIRQIVSLCIVFAGLWLGFMYIIDRGDQFKKYIPWVIIFALFVNFSYPLARTLTDVSNLISLNIYTSALGTDALSDAETNGRSAGTIILNRLGLINLVDLAVNKGDLASSGFLNNIDSTPGALVAIALLIYTAYVFLTVTILLSVRTGILVFLIVASPLLFVDSVIPKLGEAAEKLRRIFVEQLTVGPVFMILLAITLQFLGVLQTGLKSVSGSGAIATIFNLILMLGIIHIMLRITKSVAGGVGQAVGGFMGNVGSFATGAALGVATGGTGLLARATLGKAAANLGRSAWVQRNQGNMIGRGVKNLSTSVATSSFDLRNSGVAQAGLSKLGLSRGMGAGQKGGYKADIDKKIADRKERFNNIEIVGKDGHVDQEATAEAKLKFREKVGGIDGGRLGKQMDKEALDKYKTATDQEKQYLFASQTKETKDKMVAKDMVTGTEENTRMEKEKERERILAERSKTQIDATNNLADSNKQLVEEMRSKRYDAPAGTTTTQSDLIIPATANVTPGVDRDRGGGGPRPSEEIKIVVQNSGGTSSGSAKPVATAHKEDEFGFGSSIIVTS